MAADCPSEEALAAYVDHALSPAKRAAVEAHLAECKNCRNLVALVIKSRSAVPDPRFPVRSDS